MSQQALFQVFGLHGYQVTNVERDEKQLFVHARPQPHRMCCSARGSGEVIRRGESTRTIRNLPIGADFSWAVVTLSRAERAAWYGKLNAALPRSVAPARGPSNGTSWNCAAT